MIPKANELKTLEADLGANDNRDGEGQLGQACGEAA